VEAVGAAEVSVGTGGDCDDSDERCSPGVTESADVVCDGVDNDCDGEIPDDVEAEMSVSGEASVESDSDGQRAQNHNSSRSNRTQPAAEAEGDWRDDDSDDDGLPTAAQARAATQLQLFGAYRDEDSDGDGLDDGMEDEEDEALEDSSGGRPAFTHFSDIRGEVQVDESTGARTLSSVAVAAQDLRDWNSEDREAFARLRAEVAANTPEQASLQITQRVLDNDRIEKIEATPTEAKVRYRSEMRLFGIIPIERTVEGRAQADGTIEVDYPWYHVLSSTPHKNELKNELQTSIEIMMTLMADPI